VLLSAAVFGGRGDEATDVGDVDDVVRESGKTKLHKKGEGRNRGYRSIVSVSRMESPCKDSPRALAGLAVSSAL
jgi:hypothetical protein